MSISANVAVIGAGNVAHHLAPALDNCGFAVRSVYSRNLRNAKSLQSKLYQAEATSSLDFSSSNCQLFIISVPDDGIEDVAREISLPLGDVVLVHTSGSVPLNVLEFSAINQTGVLYPLQTFTRGRKLNIDTVPFLIEGSDKNTIDFLKKIAGALSKSVHVISSEQRQAIHVAAVYASNFTNHMLTMSRDILDSNNLKFDLLKPLIVETINKAMEMGSVKSQTGPAVRHDYSTIDKHLEFLSESPEYQQIYQAITQHIINTYNLED